MFTVRVDLDSGARMSENVILPMEPPSIESTQRKRSVRQKKDNVQSSSSSSSLNIKPSEKKLTRESATEDDADVVVEYISTAPRATST